MSSNKNSEQFFYAMSQMGTQYSMERLQQQQTMAKFYLAFDTKPVESVLEPEATNVSFTSCAFINGSNGQLSITFGADIYDLEPNDVIFFEQQGENDPLFVNGICSGCINISYSYDVPPTVVTSGKVCVKEVGTEADDEGQKLILFEIMCTNS